jgi:hypothetical protein
VKRLLLLAVLAAGCKGPATIVSGNGPSLDGGADAGAPDGGSHGNADADAGEPAPGVYAAYNVITSLYRYRITKTDLARNLCFMVGLVGPQANTSKVTLPPDWSIEYAQAMRPSTACQLSSEGTATATFDAENITGTISWTGNNSAHSIDSLQVSLFFNGLPAEKLSAANVPIQ